MEILKHLTRVKPHRPQGGWTHRPQGTLAENLLEIKPSIDRLALKSFEETSSIVESEGAIKPAKESKERASKGCIFTFGVFSRPFLSFLYGSLVVTASQDVDLVRSRGGEGWIIVFFIHKTYLVMNNCQLKEKKSIRHRNLNSPQNGI